MPDDYTYTPADQVTDASVSWLQAMGVTAFQSIPGTETTQAGDAGAAAKAQAGVDVRKVSAPVSKTNSPSEPPKKKPEEARAAGSGANAAAEAENAEALKVMKETAKLVGSLTDEAARDDAAEMLKRLEEERKSAQTLGDQTGRVKALEAVVEKAKNLTAKVVDKVARAGSKKQAEAAAAGAKTGGEAAKVKTESLPEAQAKSVRESKVEAKRSAGAIISSDKTGVAVSSEKETETEIGEGAKSKRSRAFEGKAWVETKKIPYTDPPDYEVTIHINIGGNKGASAEREGKVDRSKSVKVSGELEYTATHKFKAADLQRYLAAVNAGTSGGWKELKLAEFAAKGRFDDAKALLGQLRGQLGSGEALEALQEGDEVELSGTASAEGEAGISKKGGGAGVGIQVGASKSGSLTRKISLKDGKYYLSIRSAEADSGKIGVGGSLDGVGMNVARAKDERSSTELTFVIEAKDPKMRERADKILGTISMAELQRLRAADKELISFETKSQAAGSGTTTSASAGPVALSVSDHSDYAETVSRGAGGETKVYTGTGQRGAALSAGDQTLMSTSQTDQFTGGAGSDNEGFGETSSTHRETDLAASAKGLKKSLEEAPLRTLIGLIKGDQKVLKESVQQEGAALTDESYARLSQLAEQGKGPWGKAWSGDFGTYKAWMAAFDKVVDAQGNRQMIAKAMAQFVGEAGSGRSATVRAAVGSTAVSFNFPDSLADKKKFYDKLVVEDPVEAAREAKEPKAIINKLRESLEQLNGLSGDLKTHSKEFTDHPVEYMEMLQRIDSRRNDIKTEFARLNRMLEPPAKASSGTAASKQGKSKAAPAKPAEPDPKEEQAAAERRNQDIDVIFGRLREFRKIEESVFAALEEEFKKFFGPNLEKLINQANRLKSAYPKWDQDMKDLCQLLQQAGRKESEAEPFKPNRKRWLELNRKFPGHEYGKGLPGYEEV